MSIRPLGEFYPPPGREATRPGGEAATARPGHAPAAAEETDAAREAVAEQQALDALRQEAQRIGMEVHLQVLPDTNVIQIQFVEPATGRVVREFPAGHLASALAAMRARLSEQIDRRA